MGLKPAPSAISALIWPEVLMMPASGLIRPLNILKSVDFPDPFRPINPRHSPRLSSKLTSFTAQNSSCRSCTSALLCGNLLPPPWPLPPISLPRSCRPYQSERLRLRQNRLLRSRHSPEHRHSFQALIRSIKMGIASRYSIQTRSSRIAEPPPPRPTRPTATAAGR